MTNTDRHDLPGGREPVLSHMLVGYQKALQASIVIQFSLLSKFAHFLAGFDF